MAILFSVQPAAAQDKIEFAGGYQYLRFLENSGSNVPTGWGAAVAGAFNKNIKIVGEVGGHYKDGTNLHTFQGGAEFGLGSNEKLMPFVRLVTGLGHFSDDFDSTNAWVFTPEFGVDVMNSSGVGVRVAAGFPILRAEGDTESTFRLFVGVVIK
jgi:hypothetical protein